MRLSVRHFLFLIGLAGCWPAWAEPRLASESKTWYDVLGLKPHASDHAIENALSEIRVKYGTNSATPQAQLVADATLAAAYLSDVPLRKLYVRSLSELPNDPKPGQAALDIEIFSELIQVFKSVDAPIEKATTADLDFAYNLLTERKVRAARKERMKDYAPMPVSEPGAPLQPAPRPPLVLKEPRTAAQSATFYDILGLSSRATRDEIKAAFKAVYAQVGPDGVTPNAEIAADAENAARVLLRDALRKTYHGWLSHLRANPTFGQAERDLPIFIRVIQVEGHRLNEVTQADVRRINETVAAERGARERRLREERQRQYRAEREAREAEARLPPQRRPRRATRLCWQAAAALAITTTVTTVIAPEVLSTTETEAIGEAEPPPEAPALAQTPDASLRNAEALRPVVPPTVDETARARGRRMIDVLRGGN